MADIDLVHDPDLELYDRFFSACSSLRYSDTVVLARTLGIQVRTIRNWKAGATFPPRKGMAIQVILWVNGGKPRKIITQAGAAIGVI